MSSLFTHTRSESLPPLVDSRVNYVLLQTMPDINEPLLQLVVSRARCAGAVLLKDKRITRDEKVFTVEPPFNSQNDRL